MFAWEEKPSAFKHASERRREMYRRELGERAGLLMRLGHSAAVVKKRLSRTVEWDFDLHARPEHAGEVDAIVDDVFKRNQK